MRRGLQVNTDFSGYGSPEVALTSLHVALAGRGMCDRPPLFWRASDIIRSIFEIPSCFLGRDLGTLKSDIVSNNVHNEIVRI